jgi:hypothetical protein
MWRHVSADCAPDEDWMRPLDEPENEVPIAVPIDVLVARTDAVAIALAGRIGVLPRPGFRRWPAGERCDERDVAETLTEVDAMVIPDAAGGVVELWEPPRDMVSPEPTPSDVPPDSWFAGR